MNREDLDFVLLDGEHGVFNTENAISMFQVARLMGLPIFFRVQDTKYHLIAKTVDMGDGLIMFDSGYQHSLYLVIDGMYRLGLNPHDLKYIFHTHGHIDHIGGTRALVELTGAKTVLGRADRQYANGELGHLSGLACGAGFGLRRNAEFE